MITSRRIRVDHDDIIMTSSSPEHAGAALSRSVTDDERRSFCDDVTSLCDNSDTADEQRIRSVS